MTDIVEQLRDLTGAQWVYGETAATLEDAVDEIERLRAECQRLAAEVSRAHKDALTWMERAAAANAEIERLRAEVARCEASLLAWIEAVGECNKDRNRLREALENVAAMSREMEHTLYAATRVAAVALAAKEPGHE